MKKRADTLIFASLFGGLVAVTALILAGDSREGSTFEWLTPHPPVHWGRESPKSLQSVKNLSRLVPSYPSKLLRLIFQH